MRQKDQRLDRGAPGGRVVRLVNVAGLILEIESGFTHFRTVVKLTQGSDAVGYQAALGRMMKRRGW